LQHRPHQRLDYRLSLFFVIGVDAHFQQRPAGIFHLGRQQCGTLDIEYAQGPLDLMQTIQANLHQTRVIVFKIAFQRLSGGLQAFVNFALYPL